MLQKFFSRQSIKKLPDYSQDYLRLKLIPLANPHNNIVAISIAIKQTFFRNVPERLTEKGFCFCLF